MPHGSGQQPLLFSLFFAHLEDVILKHGLEVMMYADDTQMYINIKSSDDCPTRLKTLEFCIKDALICMVYLEWPGMQFW